MKSIEQKAKEYAGCNIVPECNKKCDVFETEDEIMPCSNRLEYHAFISGYTEAKSETLHFTEWMISHFRHYPTGWIHRLALYSIKNLKSTKELYDFYTKRKEKFENERK